VTPLHSVVIPTLMVDEGFRRKPYRCTAGKLTVGYGTNLDEGLTDDEAMFLLESRVARKVEECWRAFPWFQGLDPVRQAVVVQMAYQLGVAGVAGFRKFCAAMARGDWQTAHDEMLDSKWAKQDSPARAQRHAQVILSGRPLQRQ
jgi:lysozyme